MRAAERVRERRDTLLGWGVGLGSLSVSRPGGGGQSFFQSLFGVLPLLNNRLGLQGGGVLLADHDEVESIGDEASEAAKCLANQTFEAASTNGIADPFRGSDSKSGMRPSVSCGGDDEHEMRRGHAPPVLLDCLEIRTLTNPPLWSQLHRPTPRLILPRRATTNTKGDTAAAESPFIEVLSYALRALTSCKRQRPDAPGPVDDGSAEPSCRPWCCCAYGTRGSAVGLCCWAEKYAWT